MSYRGLVMSVVVVAAVVSAGLQSCLAHSSPAAHTRDMSRSVKLAGRLHQSAEPSSSNESNGSSGIVVGGLPHQFEAMDLNGKPANLWQYRGKVVLLDFWATWCGPCCDEVPNVVKAYNKYHNKGFDVLAISLDNSRSDLVGFIKKNHVPYRQVYDGQGWEGAVPKLYGVDAIPHSILISRTGKILAIDPRGTALAPAIQSALANKVPVAPHNETGF